MLTELDVINSQLATMGQAPLTSLTKPHRLAASGLEKLRRASHSFQTRGWWFNTVDYEVVPDATTGYITTLPANVLGLTVPQPLALALRKNGTGDVYLYDLEAGAVYKRTVTVRAHLEIAFADLPPLPQQFLHDLAVWDFQKDFDSDAKRSNELETSAKNSYAAMHAEHIKTLRVNVRAMPEHAHKMHRIRGSRPYTYSY